MTAKAIVVALVGVGCVGAAGLGAYLAVQSSAVSMAAPAVAQRADVVAPVQPSALLPEPAALEAPQLETASKGRSNTTSQAPRPATAGGSGIPVAAPSLATAQLQARPTPQETDVEATASTQVADQPPAFAVDTPSAPALDERTVTADNVIGIRLETPLSSETARVEDRVTARVIREVKVEGRTAIPAGARLEGFVTMVERGGKLRDRARIGLRFATLVVGDERIPIQTEAIFRDGEPPANEATSKIGASAVIGSILGAVLGGRRGAVAGSVAGAAGGTAAVMSGDRNEASIPAGTPLTVRLTAPVTVLAPHEE